MFIVDGKLIAEEIKKDVAAEVALLQDHHDLTPHVTILAIGENEAMMEAIEAKEKLFHSVGFMYSTYNLPDNVLERDVIEVINFLNVDEEVDGICIQMPLPASMKEIDLLRMISVGKDVDCQHPDNIMLSLQSPHAYQPALPFSIIQIIERNKLEFQDKKCVIIESKPGSQAGLSVLLSTMCEVQTVLYTKETIKADLQDAAVIVVDINIPNQIHGAVLPDDIIIIDMGHHKIMSSGEVVYEGDVKVDQTLRNCNCLITYTNSIEPVMSSAILVNTINAKRRKLN